MCQSQKKRRRRKSSWGGGYKVVKCRTLWRIALVHSAAVTYAPWSPHARTYTRTTQGPVCVSKRHSCVSIIYFFGLYCTNYTYLVLSDTVFNQSQSIAVCRSRLATELPGLGPNQRPITDLSKNNPITLDCVDKPHTCRSNPPPLLSIQNKQQPIFILAQPMHRN